MPSFARFARARIGALAAALLVAPSALPAQPTSGLETGSRIPRPRPGTIDYALSWGASSTHAERAYGQGATGAGVTVAMVDTGLTPEARGLFRALSPDSTDLVAQRRQDDGDRRHGEQTASLLAASFDGHGLFGIAYDATLLSIRADLDGSCRKICSFNERNVAAGIDYAVAHGARVIGLPLAARRPLPIVERAIARAVAGGAVIVASAGNDGAAEPVWPGRYAADPRFAGSMIVAGATTYRGAFWRQSNRAGSAAARYITAPGDNVVVDCGEKACSLVSGTSYSVAYVAGAVALVLSRAPQLDGAKAADLVLASASRPLLGGGAPEETGRGRLDVARAMRLLKGMEQG